MENVKVSIIIPVYNTAAYLEEAVNSIRRQSLADIEIIAINDGSTDNSLEILQQIQKEDPRLKIYTQVNQGQSVARNTGISHATGTFIYFFDSDDFLQEEALSSCYQTAVKDESDIVFFDATILNRAHSESISKLPYQRKDVIEEKRYRGTEVLKRLMNTHKFSASPCLNFIRMSYLKEIQLVFYPGIIHEDQLFTFLLYLQANYISFIPEDFFLRRIRECSTMTSPVSMRNINGYLTVCKELNHYPKAMIGEQKELIQMQIKTLVNIIASTSISLPFANRMDILRRLLIDFAAKLQPQSILLLLLPWLKLKKNKPI